MSFNLDNFKNKLVNVFKRMETRLKALMNMQHLNMKKWNISEMMNQLLMIDVLYIILKIILKKIY